jgi:NADH-quinone oxidoreductase subunit C
VPDENEKQDQSQQPDKPVADPAQPPEPSSGEKPAAPTPPVTPKPPAAPGEPKAAAPKPPPPPPSKPAGAPAVPPKPKGPVAEPWSSPLVEALKEKFGDEIVKSFSFIGQNQVQVKKDRIVEIMTFLRDNDVIPFEYLVDETAVHWPKDEEFEIVYILYSFAKNERLRVKTRIKEWEEIASVFSVWSTADWLEREVYDMFGVRYANHPNLRRILLPEDWVGYPLRKDYDQRLQDVEWVRKHLGIESGQKYYVDEARSEEGDYVTPQD